jgi:hypothetical protein
MSTTLLITVKTTTFPYSVACSTVTFSGSSSASAAKSKIERDLCEYNSGMTVTVTTLEGTA